MATKAITVYTKAVKSLYVKYKLHYTNNGKYQEDRATGKLVWNQRIPNKTRWTQPNQAESMFSAVAHLANHDHETEPTRLGIIPASVSCYVIDIDKQPGEWVWNEETKAHETVPFPDGKSARAFAKTLLDKHGIDRYLLLESSIPEKLHIWVPAKKEQMDFTRVPVAFGDMICVRSQVCQHHLENFPKLLKFLDRCRKSKRVPKCDPKGIIDDNPKDLGMPEKKTRRPKSQFFGDFVVGDRNNWIRKQGQEGARQKYDKVLWKRQVTDHVEKNAKDMSESEVDKAFEHGWKFGSELRDYDIPAKTWKALRRIFRKFKIKTRYNTLTQKPETSTKKLAWAPLGREAGNWEDDLRANIAAKYIYSGPGHGTGGPLEFTNQQWNQGIVKMSRKSEKVNPLEQWWKECGKATEKLYSLEECQKQIDEFLGRLWAAHVPGAETNKETKQTQAEYIRRVSSCMWLNSVLRGLEPGCDIGAFPLLIGPSRIWKSTVVGLMLPPQFRAQHMSGLKITDHFDKAVQETVGKNVIEWPECAGHRGKNKADLDTLNSKLLEGTDTVRLPYRRDSEDLDRTWSIIATMNPRNSFEDDAAFLRRLMGVHLSKFTSKEAEKPYDIVPNERNVNWGCAYRLVKAGKFHPAFPDRLLAVQKLATASLVWSPDLEFDDKLKDWFERPFDGWLDRKQLTHSEWLDIDSKDTAGKRALSSLFGRLVTNGFLVSQRVRDIPAKGDRRTLYRHRMGNPKSNKFIAGSAGMKSARDRYSKRVGGAK